MTSSLDNKTKVSTQDTTHQQSEDVSAGAMFENSAPAIQAEYGQTKRGLSPRHVLLMAIGGAIGTGLFVGIDSVLQQGGPLSMLLGFIFWSIFFIWPLNLCVAEMSAYLPVCGTIFELVSRVVNPAFDFAMG